MELKFLGAAQKWRHRDLAENRPPSPMSSIIISFLLDPLPLWRHFFIEKYSKEIGYWHFASTLLCTILSLHQQNMYLTFLNLWRHFAAGPPSPRIGVILNHQISEPLPYVYDVIFERPLNPISHGLFQVHKSPRGGWIPPPIFSRELLNRITKENLEATFRGILHLEIFFC